jgi:hypothetical protein
MDFPVNKLSLFQEGCCGVRIGYWFDGGFDRQGGVGSGGLELFAG